MMFEENEEEAGMGEWVKRARLKGAALGHVVGDVTSTGSGNDRVYNLQCLECLVQAHITIDGFRGVLTTYQCDPEAVDKTIEFTHDAMSKEHRERIEGPWLHPANAVRA